MATETEPLLQQEHDTGEQSAASASAAVIEKAPKWERRFANAVFFLLGCTFLLPWNSILVEAPYIAYRVRDSPFTDSYLSFISLVYLISNLGFMALANWTQAKVRPCVLLLNELTRT